MFWLSLLHGYTLVSGADAGDRRYPDASSDGLCWWMHCKSSTLTGPLGVISADRGLAEGCETRYIKRAVCDWWLSAHFFDSFLHLRVHT